MKTREEIIKEGIFNYLDNNKLKEELYSSAYYILYLVEHLKSIDYEFIDNKKILK